MYHYLHGTLPVLALNGMQVPIIYCTHTGTGMFTRSKSRRKIRKVVAKTEQNADDDTSIHTNPSTSMGMCQYVY
jgi:hypothetical protein